MFSKLRQNVVLRKWHGRFDAAMTSDQLIGVAPSSGPGNLSRLGMFIAGTAIALLAILVIATMLHPIAHTTVAALPHSLLLGLAGVTAAKKSGSEDKKPANIRKMEADLKALARELEQGQVEMAAGPIAQERGEELEEKAHEMEELQSHIDRYNRIAGITKAARTVDKVTMPGDDEDHSRRALYTTPGHLFVSSNELKNYMSQGKQGWSAKVNIGKRFGKKLLLRGEAAKAFEAKAYDAANLPVLGDDAIIPYDRDPEIVRFEEPEILTIRDVLNATPTTSDAIRFVKHTVTTRGAATVARGNAKPYLKVEFEPDTVSVETIAVLSKITEQDVDDAPRLIGYINGEMTLDVRVEEERQITWGSGVNELLGLFAPANAIPEFNRAGVGDTIIDTIRRMRTDLRKKRVSPNFVAIDPVDWEEVELSKGTTDQYLWGLITDLRGPRIWSLRVVESDAMTNPETNERRLLLGDGVRGATIYDRHQVQLAVGYVDDDFARNLRTLRAEERLALAVKRAFAFEYSVTAEASS